MAKFIETSLPPRKYQHKSELRLEGEKWDQDALTQWIKEFCTATVWWNHTKFYERCNPDPKSVVVNLWFERKDDAAMFKLVWQL